MAARRVGDESVFHAVEGVARGDDRLMDHRILGRRDEARRILQHRLGDRELPRVQICARVRRCAGDDAVVVVRKALRLGEALASAGRAAVPVRPPRAAAVERVDDRLRLDGHLVLGAIREVDELFGMAEREPAAAAGVARIGRARRVAALQRVGHRRITDRPRPAAVADRLELAVPSGRRQPHFDLDVGVARRRQRRRDAAERRKRGERSSARAPARRRDPRPPAGGVKAPAPTGCAT